jgi:hypothetical protein
VVCKSTTKIISEVQNFDIISNKLNSNSISTEIEKISQKENGGNNNDDIKNDSSDNVSNNNDGDAEDDSNKSSSSSSNDHDSSSSNNNNSFQFSSFIKVLDSYEAS